MLMQSFLIDWIMLIKNFVFKNVQNVQSFSSQSRSHTLHSQRAGQISAPKADQYARYLQYGCLFAQRVTIVLWMEGLQGIIPVIILDSTKTPEGFRFTAKLGNHTMASRSSKQSCWKESPEYKGSVVAAANQESYDLLIYF